MRRTIAILITIGVAMILLGIAVSVIDIYKDEVCRNTQDLEWYYYNCIGG